ncbi:O-methyltransferase [Streptomyces sp. CRN 30]|uniref:O-methyltransferase n=1 Tax=Streptomyces sp. CRN 30 TaxID=3075613 RepID=UPI0039C2A437
MLFVDGDKKSYPSYLRLGFPLLQPGGLLIADDAFAHGDFGAESDPDADPQRETRAVRAYAGAVGRSPQLFSAFVATEAGLLVRRKKHPDDR